MTAISVYTDGSATISTKPGGYGWVLVINGKKHSEGSGHMELASNNDAEMMAAIEGMRAASSYIETQIKPLTIPEFVSVTLCSDSQLILGWITGEYQFKQQDKILKYRELILLAKTLNIRALWIKGHSGNEHNERCDKLANAARLQKVLVNDKEKALKTGESLIGTKKNGIISLWYKDRLKIIDLDNDIVENYDRTVHGPRGSALEIKEEKFR